MQQKQKRPGHTALTTYIENGLRQNLKTGAVFFGPYTGWPKKLAQFFVRLNFTKY